jgi:hypothetical protein
MNMTPAQCIEEAIWNNLSELKDTMSKQERLSLLSDAVLQFLDAAGYTLVGGDAVWRFHDGLQDWLNQDRDEHRLSTFTPYDDWLNVWRSMPPRSDNEGNIIIEQPIRR